MSSKRNNEKQAFYKLSFWLSERQYDMLIKYAGRQCLSRYARRQLFYTPRTTHNTYNVPSITKDDAAHILALLGKARLHSNINQIAHKVNCGTVTFSEEVNVALLEATGDIKDIRARLIDVTKKQERV